MLYVIGFVWAVCADGIVVLCEVGDVVVSDVDFYVGLNFVGVLKVLVIFVVWSTGEIMWVVECGEGYGVYVVVIDGGDVDAVVVVVAEVVDWVCVGEGFMLVEVWVI